MSEMWKDIKGYEGLYQVSNLGNVRSLEHLDKNKRNRIVGRVLKPGMKAYGYLQVGLRDGYGKQKNYYVHRLVMEAFVGECPDGCEVNHIDENKANNNISNLEYVTHKTNMNYGTNIQRRATKRRKAVVQYSWDGNVTAEYESTVEAEKATGVWHNNISKVCKGKTKTAGGFMWKYKRDE